MVKRITISLEDGVYRILQKYSKKLGTKESTICRDLIIQKLNDMSLITSEIKE